MIRVKREKSCLFTPFNTSKILNPTRIHCIVFFCWILLILIGTFLIGLSTNLYTKQFQYCQEQESFCSRTFTLDSTKDIFIYIVLQNFYQNNRMFLDSFSPLQFQGNIHNNYHCEGYDTYQSLKIDSNAGGYRVNPLKNAHPCGKVMLNIFNDAIYLITSQGGAPVLDQWDLSSEYNRNNKFINLQNYQLRQWIDIQSSNFVNYFTVPYTSTKYMLYGKLTLAPDTYQLIVKNNYQTKGMFKKKILISEVNSLGIRDPVIGFYMFVWGILTLFFHLFLCCKGLK